MDTNALYWMPNLLAGILTAIATALLWKRLAVRGALSLFLVTFGAAIWAICEAMILMKFDMNTRIFITKAQYIGITIVPPALLFYVFAYIGSEKINKVRYYIYLSIIPALTLLLAWTNEWHNLIWTRFWIDDTGPFPMLANTHAPMFWFYAFYSYGLIAVSAVVIIKHFIKSNVFFRKQLGVILAAMAFPFCGNIIYNFGLSPIPNMDLTALAFNFTGLALAWGFFRYRLYDVIPIARDEVFKGLQDGVIVFDGDDQLIDFNPAAISIFDLHQVGLLIGRKASVVFEKYEALVKHINQPDRESLEVPVKSAGINKTYDLKMNIFSDHKGKTVGKILVFRDITARKELESELQRLAETDALTGIRNRRCILEYGAKDFRKSKRYKRPMSVLMLDVDHFKRINDTYGHQTGDEVLKQITKSCQENLREPDVIGRVGGEEFMVVLPETDIRQATKVAERLRSKIEGLSLHAVDGALSFTISVGAAQITDSDKRLEDVIKRSDEALYVAKTRGRNIVIASEADSIVCRI